MTYKTTVTPLDSDDSATEDVLSFWSNDIPPREEILWEIRKSKWGRSHERSPDRYYPFAWRTTQIKTVDSGDFKLKMIFQVVDDEL